MTCPWTVELLPAGDPATDAELSCFFAKCTTSFAQQTPGWRDVIAGLGVDEPLFLGCRRGGDLVGVLPGYRFEGPLGAILTSCAQAGPLGGVAVLPDVESGPVYEVLLDRFGALAAERHCAVATVIGNPLFPDGALCEKWFAPDYTLENVSQILDLDEALDSRGDFHGGTTNLQRNLRKALAGRLVVDDQQTRANVETWYEIHTARHREIGAVPLPRQLFLGALEHMVPRDKARFFFVRLSESGEMVAGGFYVCHGSVIDALMPSVSTSAASLGPNFLLALHSMRWARERGVRHYNWQPSPPESGVHRFKRQWGSRDVNYAYYTRITGDVEPILSSSPEEVRNGYPWHYVLPFDRMGVEQRTRSGVSSRRSAWSAGEGSEGSEP